ncbi:MULTISPECIES: SDR family NAD(P)-dependent oxidoreductase [unclassified Sphingopyxis]|uniref:SDR family NAD(P)-dependent oxidoreductase n=1 Tax=unclassified Sphingopyxis TaxID=2614943 RepID=UPI0006BEB9F5|nr:MULTISPECIES: SDR family NAD(P)-dependent oxidoreductase [unclassified Sphingopyxis]USI76663.1 SDR family oxidoreductase [Sphingopyxis sp. USTB-05]GAO80917.1 3-oxoacyl-[acyl-carrier protein] reductase [Sphingopyxis sp. C-1]
MTAGRLAGRAALVTGAGSGIGLATAKRLTADGAQVLTTDRAGEVDIVADVTAPGANARLVADAEARFGRLDIVVACAGITGLEMLDGAGDEFFDAMMAVNVTAVFRLMRDALPLLKRSSYGRIVLIGSVMSSFGEAGMTAYSASKHAVLGMTKSVAAEVGAFGITVNCIQPGAIDTPMTAPAFAAMPEFRQRWIDKAALGRLGQPEDIADVAAFLASDDARFMSGHGVFVDGGATQRQ